MRLSRLLRALLFLLAGLASAIPVAARAQHAPPNATPRPAAKLNAADIERLTSLLQDEARRAEFVRTLEALSAASRTQTSAAAEGSLPPPATAEAPAAGVAPAAPAPAARAPIAQAPVPQAPAASAPAAPAPAAPAPAASPPAAAEAAPAEPLIAPNTVGAQLLLGLSERIGTMSDSLLQAARTMADLPALWDATRQLVADPFTRGRILDAAWKVLLLLAVGLLAEWLLVRALARPHHRLDRAVPTDGSGGPGWSWLRRLPVLLARLVLDLMPIAGFGLAVYGLFGLVDPLPTTRLVGLMVAHAYMAARIAFTLAWTLFSPISSHLRLIPCSDGIAAASTRWIRWLMLVGVGGYTLAQAGLLLGLPWAAYDAILNITLLLISLLLVRLVLRHQDTVARVLRAKPLEPGETAERSRLMLRGVRNQMAEVWHIAVILWLVASWVVWALALENGLQRLIWGTVLTLVVIGIAKLLDEGFIRLTAPLLDPSPEMARRWPGLQTRAPTYVPLLRTMVSVLLGIGAVVLLLETWGFDSLDWLAPGTLGNRLMWTLFSILLTLVLGLVVWEAANSGIQRWLTRSMGDTGGGRSARVRTLLPMLRTVVGGLILVFVVLNALSQLGLNVAPLLAGAGVIGLAVGFGSQTLVRDVITGVFLLLEDAVAVGEVVQIDTLSGVVETLSIRSIKLRAFDGSVHFIPFSAVTTVTNMTRDFSFAVLDVTVGYREDTDRVFEVLDAIVKEMRGEAKWQSVIRDDMDLVGVERFGDSGVMLKARVKTTPMGRWNVLRELNRRIKQRFDELGIEIPYPYQRLVIDGGEQRFPPPPGKLAGTADLDQPEAAQ